MSLYYADTSAVIKLLAEETHSHAFAAFYDANADAEWVSSALLRIELTRAVTRATPALLPEARDLLLAFSSIAIDEDIVEGAMNEPDRGLRSLDAIHLATARVLGPDLDAVVSYDGRLIKAARDAGLTTLSPGDHAFVRTRPAVKLSEIRTVFVSRSEARRLLDGLDTDFDTVEVDFTGVTDVGQGFVDELLRVWPSSHPGKTVTPTNMNEAVEFMIQRGLSRVERPEG